MSGRHSVRVRDGSLTAPEYPVAWCEGERAMDSVPAEVTQSWVVVKAAVALSPILIFLTADVIEWFLRRWLIRSRTSVRSMVMCS
jgi:hypothetical protein